MFTATTALAIPLQDAREAQLARMHFLDSFMRVLLVPDGLGTGMYYLALSRSAVRLEFPPGSVQGARATPEPQPPTAEEVAAAVRFFTQARQKPVFMLEWTRLLYSMYD